MGQDPRAGLGGAWCLWHLAQESERTRQGRPSSYECLTTMVQNGHNMRSQHHRQHSALRQTAQTRGRSPPLGGEHWGDRKAPRHRRARLSGTGNSAPGAASTMLQGDMQSTSHEETQGVEARTDG